MRAGFTVMNEPPKILDITDSCSIVFDRNGYDDIKEIHVYVDGVEVLYSVEVVNSTTLKIIYNVLTWRNITVVVIDNAGDSDSKTITNDNDASIDSVVLIPIFISLPLTRCRKHGKERVYFPINSNFNGNRRSGVLSTSDRYCGRLY